VSARLATATSMGLREQARRPLLIVLLVGLPFFFITRAIAKTEATPRTIGLPGGSEALTTMRDLHGANMATITIAFLAGLCGVFVMNSARRVDRRLVVAGFRPLEALIPRLVVLAAATVLVVVVSCAVTALSFTPHSWAAFVAGNLLVGLTYGSLGALAGALLGPLGATYTMLLGSMLDLGIAQNPMFGTGTPHGWAHVLPGYGAGRVVVDASFSETFHAWGELALGFAWALAMTVVVAGVLRQALGTADRAAPARDRVHTAYASRERP
jgi:hypothetical protein